MESLIKKVVSAKDINHKGQGLWVSMKILMGDLKQVQKLNIFLLTTIFSLILHIFIKLFLQLLLNYKSLMNFGYLFSKIYNLHLDTQHIHIFLKHCDYKILLHRFLWNPEIPKWMKRRIFIQWDNNVYFTAELILSQSEISLSIWHGKTSSFLKHLY